MERAGPLAQHLLSMGVMEVIVQVGNQGGAPHTRNLGAEKARGEVLLFVDADNWPVGTLSFLPEAASYWTATFADGTGDEFTRVNCEAYNRHHQAHWKALLGGFVGVRREAFRAVGGWPEDSPYDDVELGFRLAQAGFRVGFVPLVTYQMRPFHPLHQVPANTWRPWESRPKDGPSVIYKASRASTGVDELSPTHTSVRATGGGAVRHRAPVGGD